MVGRANPNGLLLVIIEIGALLKLERLARQGKDAVGGGKSTQQLLVLQMYENGIGPQAKIRTSVHIRILGPISVRIRIGHSTAYTRVLYRISS